ncbi:hypothetical protein TcasGA2_TC004429 [Tribolium castaneum]|uniref:Uncharacterized protein n=1 Tax=Tribolium castaneum TaxID=7070 RepID=D6WCZ0_TRICA|nr:hypothetical protein TcasGA2_TC004429 [Tribolium castaneum]
MNSRHKNESLEASLKESLVVNPLGTKVRQATSSQLQQKPKTAKLVKASQSLHRGRPGQAQFPVKRVMFGVEQNFAVKTRKKPSTLDFIEKLKKIETKTEKSDFLEQANDEIDIASKQLEALRKLLTQKLQTQAELKAQQEKNELRNKQKTLMDNCNRQFEKMQKQYLNKTKIRFKSLKDVENMTLPRPKDAKQDKNVKTLYQGVVAATSSENFDFSAFDKNQDLDKAGPLLKTQVVSVASQHEILAKPAKKASPKAPQKVRFDDSILNSVHYSPAGSNLQSPERSDGPDVANIKRLLSVPAEDLGVSRFRKKIDESCLTTENFSTKYKEGRRKLNLLLHGKEKLDNVQFDDAKLEESVLKSAFLSKEFCSGENEASRRNRQLVESVMLKLHENKTGRRQDRKLSAVLKTVLQNSLFSELAK